MADMHVIDGDNADRWTVVMHVGVPTGNNSVGVLWSSALINSGLGGTTQLPDGDGEKGTITPEEKTAIQSGTVHEVSGSFLVESGGTSTAQLKASLRKFYGMQKTKAIDDLKRSLKYYGHTESEV